MEDHRSRRHARQVLSLAHVLDQGIGVEKLGRASQVEVVSLLTPASHRAPSWHFQVEGTRFVWQVADTVRDRVVLSVLV